MNTTLSTSRRRRRAATIATLVVGMLAAGLAVQQSLSAASAVSSQPSPVLESGAVDPSSPGHDGTITAADGQISHGQRVSVFDDVPAVTNLDGALRDALRRATDEASADGVELRVNSGWRSPEYQDRLLSDAVHEHGSAQEAARWVAPADTSEHVSGDAVDIGPWQAADWLGNHGAGFGLCRIYANEPWHFELRPDAVRDGCPRVYRDPTERRR
ncbi:M15 family metallopeptidase [Microbacterium sp. NPDC058342]|uniref:M15 family metallopeptidase n=1 Tax=Microbacterium sp. NPDC058342 TaxID=3346454 RepID=UPI003659D19E